MNKPNSSQQGHEEDAPRILAAADLTHLDPRFRGRLIGRDEWQSRRAFLRSLLGAGAVLAVPSTMIQCFGGESGGGNPSLQADAGGDGSTQADSPGDCATQAVDAGPEAEPDAAGTSPRVVHTIPPDGANSVGCPSTITIAFDKFMNHQSVEDALAFEPPLQPIETRWEDQATQGERLQLVFAEPLDPDPSLYGLHQ
jgi:hypothetical protein